LLDYVHPRDLENGRPGRKPPLPNLNDNILCGNFFDDGASWQKLITHKKADWVVGNPPWKQLKTNNKREEDEPVLAWIKDNENHRPVGNNQMARAFAWRVAEYVAKNGEIALFLPAMTLFEEAAKRFRSRFLEDMTVHTIANFSNLRWVISGGRFSAPAAAFFYRPRPQTTEPTDDESIRTYSPLVANQEATRPAIEGKHNETWSIVINASEIRDVPLTTVANGDGLPWKMAAWGSDLDLRLIRSLRRRFSTIGEMERDRLLIMREGAQLKDGDPDSPPTGMKAAKNLLDKQVLDVTALEGVRDCFAFPNTAIKPNTKPLLRLRGGDSGLGVCQPPHVIVSAARNFAVYSEDFIIVPPRQIGIVSPANNTVLLKALSVFLSSDFAFYYEFYVSTELGVGRDRSTLKTLRTIPTPLAGLTASDLNRWAKLHDKLAKATRDAYQNGNLWPDGRSQSAIPQVSAVGGKLITDMNSLVYGALGLEAGEQLLVHDLVRVRLALNDGRLGKEAVRKPTVAEIRAYGLRLQAELDDYIGDELQGKHDVEIVHDDRSGMVRVRLSQEPLARSRVVILQADAPQAKSLEKCRGHLRQKRSQWVYFDRNLRVYHGKDTYILKPMQRFQWTETQARVDAMEMVTESIARRGTT
jgi:hypothetical protein